MELFACYCPQLPFRGHSSDIAPPVSMAFPPAFEKTTMQHINQAAETDFQFFQLLSIGILPLPSLQDTMTEPNGRPYPLKEQYDRPTEHARRDPDRTRRRSKNVAPTTAPYPETGDDDRRCDRGSSFVSRGQNSQEDYTEPEPRFESRRPRDDRRRQIEDDKITHAGGHRGAGESSGNRTGRRDRSTHRNDFDTSRREAAATGGGMQTRRPRDRSQRPARASVRRSRSQVRERSTTGERRLVTTGTTRGERGRERGQSRPPSRTGTPSRPRVSSRARPTSRDRDLLECRDNHRSRSRRPMTGRERREEEDRRVSTFSNYPKIHI
jgi:hypothetical protein